jgi:phosphate transport system permease protein
MALPTQIYDWISRPQQIFQDSAAAGIVVVMVVLLIANSVAIVLRNRFQRRS